METNNYIGAKIPAHLRGKGQMSATKEEIDGKLVNQYAEFMKFNSLYDMAKYHVWLLNRDRYKAFNGNVSEFANRVKQGGYATDSRYIDSLNNVIRSIIN